MKDVNEMLRYLIKIGYTEEAIAMRLKVNQSTISRILSGKIREPRNSIIIQICIIYEKEIYQAQGNS
jgi:transcriptional regulator with XRE-family HTH domain